MKVEGVGFGVHGEEESYLAFIDDNGEQHHVAAHDLVPSDGRVSWSMYEALVGGFGERSDEILTRESDKRDMPRAYRIRITVEAEPLTYEETQALLAKAKRRNEDL